MRPDPRDIATRLADTRRHLHEDVDLWMATASSGAVPGLVPLSFDWDGRTILVVTSRRSPAGTNLRDTGRCRAALGSLRDVVMVDATADQVVLEEVPAERWQRFAERTGWDPRASGPDYAAYLLRPTRVQAWREENELAGRTLMRDGTWVDEEP
ncbi:pyridoxamine 5'-phosphate oxidase family protein [Phycicoccus sp. CSK15P-2]|uniref:pyridoxamine 5'-phosphate oxidase family protein n=1 Tax=Phycicoccus sp. CSK15P-2 TaxID=2807627 RepID=UPI00194F04BE|nr:pyridoxamine 5'-phosphate oxidase family protein [Phycicoccus sp. CSK15P-2]MBM6405575.1 pyridoxamine 5'-phosphate oxidase family protein [Phycicoccus sp. CSK15P-2]